MAANSVVSDGIWPKFEFVHTFMYVLVTYKDEENQMKNEGTRVVTTLYIIQLYLRRSVAANSVAGGWVWPKIKHIHFLGVSLLPARMRKIHSKMKVLEWSQQISHCMSMLFLWCSRAVNSTVWGWFYFKFKLIQAFMVVLVTWQNDEIQSKMKAIRVVTSISLIFHIA